MPRCPRCFRRLAPLSVCPRDGEAAGAGADAGAAPELPGFHVESPIGAGGFSTVWQVRSAEGGSFALKLARIPHPAVHARFAREARALERLGPPWTPALLERGVLADGRPFLLLERLSGETLATWLERLEAPLEFGRLSRLVEALLVAFEQTVLRGILHRDLKPENIVLLDERSDASEAERALDLDGAPRLAFIDFGSARDHGERLCGTPGSLEESSRSSVTVGTIEYMAPERVRGERDDERSEVYALGAVMYELTTSRPPFPFTGRLGQYAQMALLPPPPSHFANIPRAYERVLLDCLAKDPERRPQTVAELRERVAACRDAPIETRRSTHSTTAALVAEGPRSAVVLWIEAPKLSLVLADLVERRRGILARTQGQRHIVVFGAGEADAPVEAALDVLTEIMACLSTVRAALHVASVLVRRVADRPATAYGAAIDRPGEWLPATAWTGVVVTPEFAAGAGPARLRSLRDQLPCALRELGSAGALGPEPNLDLDQTSLVGREDVLATIESSLSTWVASGRSVALVALGDAGLGKSRLAAEASARVRARSGAICFVLTGARTRPWDAARELLRQLVRPEGAMGGDESASEIQRSIAASDVRAVLETPTIDGTPVRATAFRALVAALRARARERPLAVVLDDAHLVDDVLLDALETAALDASTPGLWLFCTAAPRFAAEHPVWGKRTPATFRIDLRPLDGFAAKQLLAEVLRPAAYPPDEALVRLCTWASNNPRLLIELGWALHRAGAVCVRPGTRSYYLNTSELVRLPSAPVWHWLAARELDWLDPSLAASARLCAVLSPLIDTAALEHVQAALTREGLPSSPLESGVALRALADRGVLVRDAPDSASYRFRSVMLAEAVYELTDSAHRERIHRKAFDYCRSRPSLSEPEGEALARHAAALGEREAAQRAYLALAQRARNEQKLVSADTHYSSALSFCDSTPTRAEILIARAGVRYRMHRLQQAIDDTVAAAELSEGVSDEPRLCAALLEEATVRDWAGDYAGSARVSTRAIELSERVGDPAIAARALVALGRQSWRRGEVMEAIEQLERAATQAAAIHQDEPRIIALLLLSCALVQAGRIEPAQRRFDEVIELTSRTDDRLHLCAALGNRAFLWAAQSSAENGIADLARTVELAREIGNPWTERNAILNLSEILYWAGRDEEALALVRQGLLLEDRFADRPVHEGRLLSARIHAIKGDLTEAIDHTIWLSARGLPDPENQSARALFSALAWRLLAERPSIELEPPELAWDRIAEIAVGCLPDERAELAYLRAAAACAGTDTTEAFDACRAAALSASSLPAWARRVRELPLGRARG